MIIILIFVIAIIYFCGLHTWISVGYGDWTLDMHSILAIFLVLTLVLISKFIHKITLSLHSKRNMKLHTKHENTIHNLLHAQIMIESGCEQDADNILRNIRNRNDINAILNVRIAHKEKNESNLIKYCNELISQDGAFREIGYHYLVMHYVETKQGIEHLISEIRMKCQNPIWISQFELYSYIREEMWDSALDLFKTGQLQDNDHRIRSLLYTAKAMNESDIQYRIKILDDIQSRDMLFVVLCRAKSYLEDDNYQKARNILQKAYKLEPHIEIGRAYVESFDDSDKQDAADFLRSIHQDVWEGYVVSLEIGIEISDIEYSAKNLKWLLKNHNTKYIRYLSCILNKRDDDMRDKYLDAQVDECWMCAECADNPKKWWYSCNKCDSFGSILWVK